MSDETEQPTGEARPGPEATEAARELAAANMVDLEHVQGTGADGKITKTDVEEHIAKSAAPAEVPDNPGEGDAGDFPADPDNANVVYAPEDAPPTSGHAPKIWTGPRR